MTVIYGGRDLFPEPPRRKHEEDDLQKQIVDHLKWRLPADAVFHHSPNGGQRHDRAAARLVGLGLRSGWPDLEIGYRGKMYFFELKTKTGVVLAHQDQTHEKLRYCGFDVFVARSLDDVLERLRILGVPIKGV
jgi:hypothetical protein